MNEPIENSTNEPTENLATPGRDDASVNPDDLRRATFPQSRKGYDREAVHSLLDRVADFVEQGASAASGSVPGIKRELERVGERTVGILTAAEEAATKLRAEAEEYAVGLRKTADEEARKAALAAGAKADEIVSQAEEKAEKMISDAVARRRSLNQAISSLAERQDEIAGEAMRLGEDLIQAVGALTASGPDADAPEDHDEEAPDADHGEPPLPGNLESESGFGPVLPERDTEPDPDDERETTLHRVD